MKISLKSVKKWLSPRYEEPDTCAAWQRTAVQGDHVGGRWRANKPNMRTNPGVQIKVAT